MAMPAIRADLAGERDKSRDEPTVDFPGVGDKPPAPQRMRTVIPAITRSSL